MTATPPPGRTARAMRPTTASSSAPPSSPKPPWQRQIAASNSPSNARSRTSSTSNVARNPVAASCASATKSGDRSTPWTSMSACRQRERMPARAAPDVEDPHPRLEAECLHEEVDLLGGALGERVLQVGRPEELGDRVEPGALGRLRGLRHAGNYDRGRPVAVSRRPGGAADRRRRGPIARGRRGPRTSRPWGSDRRAS